MSDIVVRLELRGAAEADAFGAYLNRFLSGLCEQVARVDLLDAPPVMVRSEPQRDAELRVVTFQAAQHASAFARGWRRARPSADAPIAECAAA